MTEFTIYINTHQGRYTWAPRTYVSALAVLGVPSSSRRPPCRSSSATLYLTQHNTKDVYACGMWCIYLCMDLIYCIIAIYVYMNICNIDCNGCGDSDTSNTVAAIVLIGIRTILLQWCNMVCLYVYICAYAFKCMYMYALQYACTHTCIPWYRLHVI